MYFFGTKKIVKLHNKSLRARSSGQNFGVFRCYTPEIFLCGVFNMKLLMTLVN